jgi:hypothetical protein
MKNDELIPKSLERLIDKPYLGLLGNTVITNLVEEVVADPYSEYRPKELEELLGVSSPAIRKALNILTILRLLEKDGTDKKRPIYTVNVESKKFIALTLLAYAVVDDKDGTDYMNEAIRGYCDSELGQQFEEPYVITAEDNLDEIYDAISRTPGALGSKVSTAPPKMHFGYDDKPLTALV